jgi:DNA polymerase-3 subunit epsilon
MVFFKDGVEVNAIKTYIDPQDFFHQRNIAIHGITPDKVAGSPSFIKYISTLRPLLDSKIIVHHGHFDRVAVGRACEKCGKMPISANWLDTAQVSRLTWDNANGAGYGLANLAARFSIRFDHHDALEDSRTAGKIFLKAINDSGISLGTWAKKLGQEYVHK